MTVFIQDLCSCNIRRHEIRGKLYPFEFQVQNLSDSAYEKRFSKARNPYEEAVAIGKKRNQYRLDYLILADDNFGNLILQFFVFGSQSINGLDIRCILCTCTHQCLKFNL